MKQKRNYLQIVTLIALLIVFSMPAHAGLASTVSGLNSLISGAMKLLNLCMGFAGAWYVAGGVMSWRKSSEQGSNLGFKEVVVPVIAGIILLGFASFIAMTSSTFGFASTTAAQMGL